MSAPILSAPTSYSGSARRLWRATGPALVPDGWHPAARAVAVPTAAVAALVLIVCAWAAVTVWYATFGLLLVPWRLIRRRGRRRRHEEVRHREILEALEDRR